MVPVAALPMPLSYLSACPLLAQFYPPSLPLDSEYRGHSVLARALLRTECDIFESCRGHMVRGTSWSLAACAT